MTLFTHQGFNLFFNLKFNDTKISVLYFSVGPYLCSITPIILLSI